MEGKKAVKVLVCCTGSVAAIKLPELVHLLLSQKLDSPAGCSFEARVILTEKARHFTQTVVTENVWVDGSGFPASGTVANAVTWPLAGVPVYSDEEEWASWKGRGDPVLHIDLTKWADLLLIAPLDANTLAKIANGICDNMLTCAVRAWDVRKPLLFCPAMNTKMWEHPITSTQVSLLTNWGYTYLPPIAKTLMCGDTGVGAMAEPSDIAAALVKLVSQIQL